MYEWKISKNWIAIFMIFILAMVFTSCAMLAGKDDTPELKEKKTYMTARKEFAMTVEKYNDYYARANPETQAEWKADIDPYFKQANAALAAWKLAIENQQDPASQEQMFLNIKKELLSLLVGVFGEGG